MKRKITNEISLLLIVRKIAEVSERLFDFMARGIEQEEHMRVGSTWKRYQVQMMNGPHGVVSKGVYDFMFH